MHDWKKIEENEAEFWTAWVCRKCDQYVLLTNHLDDAKLEDLVDDCNEYIIRKVMDQ